MFISDPCKLFPLSVKSFIMSTTKTFLSHVEKEYTLFFHKNISLLDHLMLGIGADISESLVTHQPEHPRAHSTIAMLPRINCLLPPWFQF